MFFSRKPDYQKIFSSPSSTFEYLYSDRSKTASIMGDNAFIDAWLESTNVGQVTSVIRSEALKGDIPSIKQMIWVCELYYQNADTFTSDPKERIKMKVHFLKERVLFSEKAVSLGLRDRSYQAMISNVNLYRLLADQNTALTDVETRTALNGIITNATLYLSLNEDDAGMNEDAKNVLDEYGKFAQLVNSINRHS
ncbi:hypothetical protein JZU71_02355 [bacterium]|nr:hypothetical protein [bacterium]